MQKTQLERYYLHHLGLDYWIKREPDRHKSLQQLADEVSHCTRCVAHTSRHQTVFARGNPHAKLMIITSMPSIFDEQCGAPMMGKVGLLLNAMLASIGLGAEDVYVTNVLKCRLPADNAAENSTAQSIDACSDFLNRQIGFVAPSVILALGAVASQWLEKKQIPVIVTVHPEDLLANPCLKKQVYADLLLVKNAL